MKTSTVHPRVWFPAIRAGSGADVFTERLAGALRERGVPTEISWLPHRAEYAPWSVEKPRAPPGTNIVHVNACLHTRFIPARLPVVATMLHCVLDPALTPYKTSLQSAYHQFWIKALEERVIERAAKVIPISRYTGRTMHGLYGTRREEAIWIGIDLETFSPSWRTAPNRPFRLLYVGNWTARKGADLIAPIMSELGPEFEIRVLAGLRSAQLTKLPENIRQVPMMPDASAMVSLYRECDALLFPSRLEGFGMVALEAQACGLPVIASNSSALPEVVRNGETGLLCEQDNVREFISAARSLSDNPQRWRAMGTAGRAHAQACFAKEVMADRYVAVYQSVLNISA